MAGMGSSCNHVAAALFRIEAAMRYGLSNPSSTSLPNEWLPNRNEVQPSKAKNIDFNRDDFAKRGKSRKKLFSTPKKNYHPLPIKRKTTKTLSFEKIVETLKEKDLMKDTTLSTAAPQPEIDFVVESVRKPDHVSDLPCIDDVIVVESVRKPDHVSNLPCIDDVILTSKSTDEFLTNVTNDLTNDIIDKIEVATKGQSTNELWYQHRKSVITASKVHEVKTKMETIIKGYQKGDERSEVLMWSLTKKIAGFTFLNPNNPALKYGREMEGMASSKLLDFLKTKHKGAKIRDCGLLLHKNKPFIGASPDGIFSCDCCKEEVCIEIKCPYSISYLSPTDENAKLRYMIKTDQGLRLRESHQYFSQCQFQMGVWNLKKCFFFVYTAHGFILNEIRFDTNFFSELSEKCSNFYKEYYLPSIFLA
uniref:YqaJ viral recombinase domain-containing protein n=1 Tax=Clytia hemisphaerica TaxID=252671 RepID=A0A7M5WWY6_9CNID